MVALAFVSKDDSEIRFGRVLYVNMRMVLVFLGTISAWLFALHPVVREYTIGLAKRGSDTLLYLSILIYLAASILLAWIVTRLSSHNSRL